MIYLLLSITFSTLLLIIFKFFDRYKIDNLQAIVFNYITAATTGFLFTSDFTALNNFYAQPWFAFALLIGTIFISLFVVIAQSSQKVGLTITSVANKMSLVIPVTAAVFLYNDPFSLLKALALVIAILGVIFTSIKPERKKTNLSLLLFPLIIFIGSGTSDTLIKYVEEYYLTGVSAELFTAVLFASSAITGILILIIKVLAGKTKLNLKNVGGGILLGIPNYFSIHFLFLAISQSGLASSDLFAINNMGIVIASAVCGILFFKEKLSAINFIGLIISLGAIAILYFEQNN